MQRPLPILLTEAQAQTLALSHCAFCNAPPPLAFGRKNVALHRRAQVVHQRTCLPSCAGCWSIRCGATPSELATHAMRIHRFMSDTNLRVQMFELALSRRPTQRCAQSKRRLRKRESHLCKAVNDAVDSVAMYEGFPCYYCGQTRQCGLDRVDSYACPSYETNNVVPACSLCNKMKHVLPVEVFLRYVAQAAQGFDSGQAPTKAKKKKKKRRSKREHAAERMPPSKPSIKLRIKTSVSLPALQCEGELLPSMLSTAFGYSGTVTAKQITQVLHAEQSPCFSSRDTVAGILGYGISAVVFLCKNANGKWFALKVMRPGPDLENMPAVVQKHNDAARAGLTRPIICSDEEAGLQRMPLMLLTLEQMIKERGGVAQSVDYIETILASLLRRLKAANFTHGDLHLQNIVFASRASEPMLIDFDKSNNTAFYPSIDAGMLLYSLDQLAHRTKEAEAMVAVERAVNRASKEYVSDAFEVKNTSKLLGMQYRYMLGNYTL